jgi:hypothetical protein
LKWLKGEDGFVSYLDKIKQVNDSFF